MIRFHGQIKALSPLTVSYPDLEGLPRTPHGEVILMAGSLRGPLRNAACKFVQRELASARGEPLENIFSLDDLYMLKQGVDTTRSLNNESSAHVDPGGMLALRKANPLLSLFGRWKLPGRISIDGIVGPGDSVMTYGRGARVDSYEQGRDDVTYLTPDDQARLADIMASEKDSHADIAELKKARQDVMKRARGAEGDARKALYDEAAEMEAQIKQAREGRSGAQESIKHPLGGYEAIAPGTLLQNRITLNSENDAELGLFLHALAEFSRTPYIGGHRSNGCGLIEASWDVSEWPPGDLEAKVIGKLSISQDGFSIEGDKLKTAASDFRAAIEQFQFDAVTADDLKAA